MSGGGLFAFVILRLHGAGTQILTVNSSQWRVGRPREWLGSNGVGV